jgi:hypothetical protein
LHSFPAPGRLSRKGGAQTSMLQNEMMWWTAQIKDGRARRYLQM